MNQYSFKATVENKFANTPLWKEEMKYTKTVKATTVHNARRKMEDFVIEALYLVYDVEIDVEEIEISTIAHSRVETLCGSDSHIIE